MANPNGDALIPENGPLECPVPDEILLTNPPLKLALAQIRFSPILFINQPNSVKLAAFQEAVRTQYPDYRSEASLSIAIGPQGVQAPPVPAVHHKFKNSEGWEITLTQDFATLATTCYRTKRDFAEKVGEMSEAVRTNIAPHRAERLGIRFIDRVEEEAFDNIGKYINPEFLGAQPVFGERVQSLMTETLLSLPDEKTMIIRWGQIPANNPIPGLDIPPAKKPSWVLDTDIYTKPFNGFDPHEISGQAEKLAGRVYAVFRKVFNDEFIRICGGKL